MYFCVFFVAESRGLCSVLYSVHSSSQQGHTAPTAQQPPQQHQVVGDGLGLVALVSVV